METPTRLGDAGPALIRNEYLITPVVARQKNPRLKDWPTIDIPETAVPLYGDDSVGVKCGKGLYPLQAVDIDSTNVALVERVYDWLLSNTGASLERVGAPPKMLVLYRAPSPGLRKRSSTRFVDDSGRSHQIELLGDGQQFVAYGVHPDTGAPYQWIDSFGGMLAVPAADLPVMTETQATQLLAAFQSWALEAGYVPHQRTKAGQDAQASPRPDSPVAAVLASLAPPLAVSTETLSAALASLNPDPDYDTWARIGMALHHQYGGGAEGFALWDIWSSAGAKYPGPEALEKHWASFTQNNHHRGRPVTAATILALARDTGTPAVEPITYTPVGDDPKPAPPALVDLSTDELDRALAANHDAALAVISPNDAAALRIADIVARAGRDLATFLSNTVALVALHASTRADLKRLSYLLLQRRYHDTFYGSRSDLPPWIEPNILRRQLRLGEPVPVTESVAAAMAAVGTPNMEYTEFGLASRFAKRWAGRYLYSPGLGWYEFDAAAGSWRSVPDAVVQNQIRNLVLSLPEEADDLDAKAAAGLHMFIRQCQSWRTLQTTIQLAQIDPVFHTPHDRLDADRWLIGALNGVVDLRTGGLLACTQDNWQQIAQLRITQRMNCVYDPEAAAPWFERTVSEAFYGNESLIGYLQRVLGYALTGDPSVERIMLIPYGASGTNGKSTILGAVHDALGDYAATAAPETFTSSGRSSPMSGSAPREDLLRLVSKRLLLVSEIDDGAQLREGLIKTITGGDGLLARGVHQKTSVQFRATWLTVMATNYKPIVKSNGSPIWNRLRLVPFSRDMGSDPTIRLDPNRPEKLRAEKAGIVAWLVRGAIEYQRRGLDQPSVITQELAAYRSEMDTVGQWVSQAVVRDEAAWIGLRELFSAWHSWSSAQMLDRHAMSASALYRKLQGRPGFRVEARSREPGFAGVRLRETGEPMDDPDAGTMGGHSHLI